MTNTMTNTINLHLESFKTVNHSYPLVQRTTKQMIELWHKTVNEFCQALGITIENAHQVRMLQSRIDDVIGGNETFIEFNGQIVGTVRTELKNTAFGLKFMIQCLKATPAPAPEPTSSPAEEEGDGVPHEIDYDRGDGTFITASF